MAIIKISIHLMHQTVIGPIHLEVTEAGGGRWLARYWGQQLEGRQEFGSFRQAERWLWRCFAELFPEHRCGRECIPSPAFANAKKRGGWNSKKRGLWGHEDG